MNAPSRQSRWLREELLHLLSLSGNLAGLCIAGVTLFHTLGKASFSGTIADDVLAFSALLFLICIFVIFFALRSSPRSVAGVLENVVDILFSVALSGMVAAGFIMVYTVW